MDKRKLAVLLIILIIVTAVAMPFVMLNKNVSGSVRAAVDLIYVIILVAALFLTRKTRK